MVDNYKLKSAVTLPELAPDLIKLGTKERHDGLLFELKEMKEYDAIRKSVNSIGSYSRFIIGFLRADGLLYYHENFKSMDELSVKLPKTLNGKVIYYLPKSPVIDLKDGKFLCIFQIFLLFMQLWLALKCILQSWEKVTKRALHFFP